MRPVSRTFASSSLRTSVRRVSSFADASSSSRASTDAIDDALVRFGKLWTGAAQCRVLVAESARRSFWRDYEHIECVVRSYLRVFPPNGPHGVDVVALCVREPRALALSLEAFVQGVVRATQVLNVGGRQITLAPGLIMCSESELRLGIEALTRAVGEREARRLTLEQPDRVLQEVGWYDDDADEDVGTSADASSMEVMQALRHYARVVPPAGSIDVDERMADRERNAKKFHVQKGL